MVWYGMGRYGDSRVAAGSGILRLTASQGLQGCQDFETGRDEARLQMHTVCVHMDSIIEEYDLRIRLFTGWKCERTIFGGRESCVLSGS